MNTVRIAITNSNFAYGVKTARRVGGRFDASSKTWLIPADANELNAPASYSWRIVAPKVNPATTYIGQESMDAEDSVF
jgi:hypothetical protein